MTPLFLYLLKVNTALLLFYLAYRYGLRRLTFYTLNRIFFLLAIVFSSACPLISFDGFISDQAEAVQLAHYLTNLESLSVNNLLPEHVSGGDSTTAGAFDIWSILTIVFWSGVLLMAARFLAQLVSLARIHFASSGARTATEMKAGISVLRLVNEKINPFSFFRCIYINPSLHSPGEQASILQHEQVHVRQWHTADILAGEINRIFYWFNPGAWLLMAAIRENLEFIADRKVLQSGVDARTYQLSLVKVGETPYASGLVNNFNLSHLKIRITMMDKKPSSELQLVKYLVLVPVIAAITLAFNALETQPERSQRSLGPSLRDTTPASSQVIIFDGEAANGTPLSDTIPVSRSEHIKLIGTADSARIRIPAYGLKSGDTGFPFLKIKEDGSESAHQIEVSKDGVSINLASDSASNILLVNNKTLILIDGKEYTYETAHKFPRDTIESLLAIAGNAARKEYGKKGEYGVVKITTK